MRKYVAILVGILFLCACHPKSIGGKQISQKSKNYYKGWFGYYYSPGNNTFELGFHPLEVDASSFEVLGKEHAKDKNFVFYQYSPLKANPATFVSLSDEFGKDAQHVFYEEHLLEGADAPSFGVNSTGIPYDKEHVFVYDENIKNYRPSKLKIDPQTAERLFRGEYESDFLRDKKGIYSLDYVLPVDRDTFHYYGNAIEVGEKTFLGSWWIDKDHLYLVEWDPDTKADKVKPVKFNKPYKAVDFLRNVKL